jgi:uncharacterized membrane protein
MKKAITAVECWGYDVFDIAIRRVQQLDRGMYPASIIYRLLLESDFAVSSFADTKIIQDRSVELQNTYGFLYIPAFCIRNILS